MSIPFELSTELLHEIEVSLDWAAGEARASADVCTFFDATALLSRAEDLDNLCATVQGVLRVRQAAEQALAIHRNPESIATCFDVIDSAGQAFHVDFDDEGESTC